MDNIIQNYMTDVYHKNAWKGTESISGQGSSQINTQYIEQELPHVFKQLGINSMLDIPCGDFAWMPRMLNNLPQRFKYHGADIVQEIIDNNQKYISDNVSFSCLDITSDNLPEHDLIFVRDCFNHLPNQKIFEALQNIKRNKIKYLAVTHFNWRNLSNIDIDNSERVEWRKINFILPPFSFKPPLDFVVEGSSEERGKDKTIAIWKVKDLGVPYR